MDTNTVRFTVFTKPWNAPIPELGATIAALGFDGIELPVRPGYPVHPDNVTEELPRAAKQLTEQGLTIDSVAGPTDEKTIAACAEAGIRLIRICPGIHTDETYNEGVARWQRDFDALLPHLDRYGVTLGVQNHSGRFVSHALGLASLLEKYDKKHIAAVWDAAHNVLQGEEPELALDIVWSHLCLVNLKNGFWERTNGPEAEFATWRIHWTTGRHGLASWPRVMTDLKRRNYTGTFCLSAQYRDNENIMRDIADDLAFARSLF